MKKRKFNELPLIVATILVLVAICISSYYFGLYSNFKSLIVSVLTDLHASLIDILIFSIVVSMIVRKRDEKNEIATKVFEMKSRLKGFTQFQTKNAEIIYLIQNLNIFNETELELSRADLTNINLSKLDLSNSSIFGSDFSNSIIKHCKFNNVKGKGVKFTNSKIISVDFNCSFFKIMNCNNCVFIGCNFDNCDLTNAKLKDSVFKNCTFRNTNLYETNFDSSSFEQSSFKNSKNLNLGELLKAKSLKNSKFDESTVQLIEQKFSVYFQNKGYKYFNRKN